MEFMPEKPEFAQKDTLHSMLAKVMAQNRLILDLLRRPLSTEDKNELTSRERYYFLSYMIYLMESGQVTYSADDLMRYKDEFEQLKSRLND
ncbi:hypothetical protein BWI93_15340 [Siphonobacter sp. BAB-5385]|uniref:hypothetical protein n=1 Tax=unclassified Siphonobacter TaxID=2635712 RepID=UPI000B9E562D|nr:MULTISPECIES: hypothetical protein [unclassified Siphonobacter]OZI07386.1 hypothetical protein BWI93_15340 [Siphonobacter sp. BAB-5385]PMD90032.1 hypothetical protein BWI97_24265 [Siphonobacter sp. BAB-5405]